MALIIPGRQVSNDSDPLKISVDRNMLIEALSKPIEDDATSDRILIATNFWSISVEADNG
jgi:hypothetical protein